MHQKVFCYLKKNSAEVNSHMNNKRNTALSQQSKIQSKIVERGKNDTCKTYNILT